MGALVVPKPKHVHFYIKKIPHDETILKLQSLYAVSNTYFQNNIHMIACCFWLNILKRHKYKNGTSKQVHFDGIKIYEKL
jgi:hypothetical protein